MVKPQYLFFTYGEPGWRGVQVRGLRIARYFKKSEVLFWNGGDSRLIKESGFKVVPVDLSLAPPFKIKIPPNIKVVIFTDLPTNELFQFSLFVACQRENKKIVVLDQAYRRGQTKEFVYKQISQNCDLLLLNSLSFLKKEESDNIKIIPPLIERRIEEDAKEKLANCWQLPRSIPWLFGIGYHERIKKKLIGLGKSLYHKKIPFHLIITGSAEDDQVEKGDYFTLLPYQIGDDFFRFIKVADLAFIKFGFLQLIEVLALGVYPVVLGEAGYLLKQKSVLDKKILDAIYLSEGVDSKLLKHLELFLAQPNLRKKIAKKIKKLHNGSLQGGKQAAALISKLKNQKRPAKKLRDKKKLVILVNDELRNYKNFSQDLQSAYILGLIASVPVGPYIVKRPDERFLSCPIDELIVGSKDEVLPHAFKEIYIFSRRKYDGLSEILPWFETWVKRIQQLIDEADVVYLTRAGQSLLQGVLEGEKLKSKIRLLPPLNPS